MLLTISKITQETPDTLSFHFARPEGFHYKAGQFLTFIFNINHKEIRRSYSLGSTPGIDDDLFITVKRKTNGEISRYLHDKFKAGDSVQCLPPAGLFTIEEAAAQHYVFLAAGSGIVPVFSLIKELLHHYPETDIQLYYQNNNEANTIYKKQLEELQCRFNSPFTIDHSPSLTNVSRFTFHAYYSNPSNPIHRSTRLNNVNLESLLTTYYLQPNTKFYLCGPEAFMRMCEFTLRVNGVEADHIRKENFIIYQPVIPKDIDTSPKQVRIQLNGAEHVFNVQYPDTILSAALAQHIELPYSCRGGRCSACMAVCKTGKVRMSVNDVLTVRDLNNGYILTCTGHPETDAEIVYP